jgi:hypothetical protein
MGVRRHGWHRRRLQLYPTKNLGALSDGSAIVTGDAGSPRG